MRRAYKTELDPNNRQRGCFAQCAGATRYVYNWALAEWERLYQAGEKPSARKLRVQFNARKDELCPWIRDLPYAVTESAFENLANAFNNYFRQKEDGTVASRITNLKKAGKWEARVARLLKKGRKNTDPGYPQYKSKFDRQKSFRLRGYRTDAGRIWLGKVIGWMRLRERGYIPPGIAYGNNGGVYATISERAGRWFVSTMVEEPDMEFINGKGSVGVDVGIKKLCSVSNGREFEGTKALYQYERKLKRLQRELSRRERGGQNWRKTKDRIARTHQKIANVRRHAQHQASHYIVEDLKPAVIVLEDLNIKGMLKNHHLAKAIADAGMSEQHRQITYKAGWRGVQVIKADRWYASSKIHFECGTINDITLADRTFICQGCGELVDRDANAAKNLAALGEPPNGRGLPGELG